MPESDLEAIDSGDVVELILDDHRRMEDLLRRLRDETEKRDEIRRAFATLHVAHAEAEESEVYPALRKDRAVTPHEAEHGEHEHAEAHEALLAVLRAGVDADDFNDLVEELSGRVAHHLTEEELTILNPARQDVDEAERSRLGEAFAAKRNELIGSDCGSVENVASLVKAAAADGLLDD